MNKKLTFILGLFLIVALAGITLGYTGYLLGYREEYIDGYTDGLKDGETIIEEPPIYYIDNRTIYIDNSTTIENNVCNNSNNRNKDNACNNGRGKKYGLYKP